LALGLRDLIGWRGVFYITGSLGLLVAVLILFGVREAPRGRSEPELAELEQIGVYRFDRTVALSLFRKPTLLFLFAQGFFGVFPWNVIQAWFFRYLETERAYATGEVFMTMIIAVLTLAIGYFVGGALGDALFRRNRRGRLFLAMTAVLLGAGFLYLTLQTPPANQGRFLIWLALTAFFMPFAAPNVVSSIYDVTPPEVRSTALAIQYFVEQSGSATAPLLAGIIAVHSSLGNAILLICVTAWLLCAFLFAFAAYLAPHDIEVLRRLMRTRAEQERVMQGVLVGSDQ
jgi:MFS family permease